VKLSIGLAGCLAVQSEQRLYHIDRTIILGEFWGGVWGSSSNLGGLKYALKVDPDGLANKIIGEIEVLAVVRVGPGEVPATPRPPMDESCMDNAGWQGLPCVRCDRNLTAAHGPTHSLAIPCHQFHSKSI